MCRVHETTLEYSNGHRIIMDVKKFNEKIPFRLWNDWLRFDLFSCLVGKAEIRTRSAFAGISYYRYLDVNLGSDPLILALAQIVCY